MVDALDPSIVPWINLEDDALNTLKNTEIELKDTTLAVSKNQTANGVKHKARLFKSLEQIEL